MDTDRHNEARENLLWFGRRVRTLRHSRDLTQEDLAIAAGFDRAVIGFIERGERNIGISHLWPLAGALGVTTADLFTAD